MSEKKSTIIIEDELFTNFVETKNALDAATTAFNKVKKAILNQLDEAQEAQIGAGKITWTPVKITPVFNDERLEELVQVIDLCRRKGIPVPPDFIIQKSTGGSHRFDTIKKISGI